MPSDEFSILKTALDTIDSLVVAIDHDGNVVYFNRACEATSGFEASEILGQCFWERLHSPEEQERLRRSFSGAELKLFPEHHENEWITRSGGRRAIAWTNKPVLDEHGAVRCVVSTGVDVTKVRHVERTMRTTEADMMRLIATANEGIWAIDVGGKTTFANERMAEMLGCSMDELNSKSMWDFMDEDWKPAATGNLEKRKQGVREQHDFLFRRADGAELWAICSTNPIEDEYGEVIGALGMITDITDRKRAEQHQRRLIDELDHRVKNTMASVVALIDESITTATSLEELGEPLMGRLRSMAAAHELLSLERWAEIDLADLVRTTVTPFIAGRTDRFEATGPAAVVQATAVSPLAMMLHELTTNAVNHGALAGAEGTVQLTWEQAERAVLITWRERGRVAPPPSSPGLGLDLIRDLAKRGLGGKIEHQDLESGVIWTIEVPYHALRLVGGTAQ